MESILVTRMNAAPGGDSSIIRTHSRLASLPYTTNPTNPSLWYSTDQGGLTLSNCDSNVWTHSAILCGSQICRTTMLQLLSCQLITTIQLSRQRAAAKVKL